MIHSFWGTAVGAWGHQGKQAAMELRGAQLCSVFGRTPKPQAPEFSYLVIANIENSSGRLIPSTFFPMVFMEYVQRTRDTKGELKKIFQEKGLTIS